MRRLYWFGFALFVLAACTSASTDAPRAPTVDPFPTVTPGRTVRGALPSASGQGVAAGLQNPATAVALANLPTATPDLSACPPASGAPLQDVEANGRAIIDEIERFLSAGGSPVTLQNGMEFVWDVLGDGGSVRSDVDLTGEGQPEVVLAYNAPDDGGTLLIMGCGNGRYAPRYQSILGGGTPRILQIGDMNRDRELDVLFTAELCSGEEERQRCFFQTQLVAWEAALGRFISLLNGSIRSEAAPIIIDTDNDEVTEIVVQLTNPGTLQSGPLRTGTLIYDWNGSFYTLSIAQFSAPRFQIQIIQEADRAFNERDTETAIRLYELALSEQELEAWLEGEEPILESYVLFRLLTAYAFIEDERRLETYQRTVDTFLDPATAPVYATMSTAFWNTLQVTGNLNSACEEAQEIVRARPEAIGLLNRYGSNSPRYTASSLCPF